MKSENNLSCPRYNNLIISILTLVFCLNFNQEKLISLKGSSNTLKPIYEISSNSAVVENISNITTVVITKKEVQSQNTYRNYYVKPTYNSLTGANLVNYAKKYLGLPYIPAGSSLASGTDCSGFTRLIFQEFGISLGRTVASQLYSGSYVAKEDLKPGDLVFYGNYQGYSTHVAIYIGDGLVIHESNPRDGVKISLVNIMVYQTARRLITENVVSNASTVEEIENDDNKKTEQIPSDPQEAKEEENNNNDDTNLTLVSDKDKISNAEEEREEEKKEGSREDVKKDNEIQNTDMEENSEVPNTPNDSLNDVESNAKAPSSEPNKTLTDTEENIISEKEEDAELTVDNSTK